MTTFEELASILSTFTPEEMEKLRSDVTAFFGDNMSDAMRNLLELLPMFAAQRQVPPPDTHLRRYTHELHRNRNRRTLHDVIRRKQAESYGTHRRITHEPAELNKRHGSVFGAVPFCFFGEN